MSPGVSFPYLRGWKAQTLRWPRHGRRPLLHQVFISDLGGRSITTVPNTSMFSQHDQTCAEVICALKRRAQACFVVVVVSSFKLLLQICCYHVIALWNYGPRRYLAWFQALCQLLQEGKYPFPWHQQGITWCFFSKSWAESKDLLEQQQLSTRLVGSVSSRAAENVGCPCLVSVSVVSVAVNDRNWSYPSCCCRQCRAPHLPGLSTP